jgi:TrmH family RNA methyltransferase
MITSTKNPRIVRIRKLAQRKHRQRQNCFLVEGLQLLGMAVEAISAPSTPWARVRPGEVYYSETLFTGETAPRLLADLTGAGAEPIPVDANVLNTLSERDRSQGLAVTFGVSDLECSLEQLTLTISPISRQQITAVSARPPKLVLILDRLQDPGNMGTIFRTADAVGVAGLFLLEPCVDPFDPKTVRSTMGSIFSVPFARTSRVDELFQHLAGLGYGLVGADTTRGSNAWQSDALRGPVALVLGNEAQGLSPDLQRTITSYVSVPQHGRAESLNVAVAGAVLMYEWLRVNRSAEDAAE